MKNYGENITETMKDANPAQADLSVKEKEGAFLKLIRGEYKDEFQNLFNREFGRRFKEMKENEEELEGIKEAVKPLLCMYDAKNVASLVNSILKEKNAKEDNLAENQYMGWTNEALKTAEKYPGFDFERECENPVFRSGLRSGIPMEHLYCGIHFDELSKIISEAAAKATLDNIRAGHGRINELGSEKTHSVKAKKDVGSLTDHEIEEFLDKIRRGEKISFEA